MTKKEIKSKNRVDIDLLTQEKQKLPLKLDEDTLNRSATVLANKLLDFVRVNGSNKKLTPQNIFRKESV